MKFELKKAKNGWVCEYEIEEGEKEIITGVEGEGTDETENFRNFVQEIIFNYGPDESRYSSRRLKVICVPGDKFEGDMEPDTLNEAAELCAHLLSRLDEQSNLEEISESYFNKKALIEAVKAYKNNNSF